MGDGSEQLAADGWIGRYRVERELSPGRTWAAQDGGGRRVVLKIVESDCLMGQHLHPMIRDRLGRVRELAHMGVANLYGAERCAEQVFLVWQYVEGRSLEQWLQQPDRSAAERLGRELRASVESMHAMGIVHGAVHARNVLVKPDGGLCLTHVSPLLYNDPTTDQSAVAALLERMGVAGADDRGPVPRGRLVRESRLESGRAGRLALAAAVIAALVGVVIAWGIWRYAQAVEAARQEASAVAPCDKSPTRGPNPAHGASVQTQAGQSRISGMDEGCA